MVVYTVHDVLADTWSFPQVSPTEASAVRDFNGLKSRSGVVSSDLECVKIGSWDSNVGKLTRCDPLVLVPADRKDVHEV